MPRKAKLAYPQIKTLSQEQLLREMNDYYRALGVAPDQVKTGPTFTGINDFRAILIVR